jgi:thiol-disulfide isomerase/thioredoxin
MKKLLLLFCLVIAAGCTRAQNNAPVTGMPPYHILTIDSTYATPANLKKHRRVMLIYFGTDCPHCQHLTMELKSKMKEFGDTQIVMITWSDKFDIRAIKAFYRDYGLKKYPNITMGTEGYTYTVQKYFRILTTPFIAVYDNEGKMVKSYDKSPDIDALVATVKSADK